MDHLPPLLGVAGQHAHRALGYRLRSGGGVGGLGGIAPLVGGGVGCCGARLRDGGAKLKIGLLELLDAGVAHARLRLETMDGILGGPQVPLELAGARRAGAGFHLQHAHGLQLFCDTVIQSPGGRLGGAAAGDVRVARGGQLVLELPGTLPLGDQRRFQLRIAAAQLLERGPVLGGLRVGGQGSGARRLDRRGQVRVLRLEPGQLRVL